MVDLYSEILKMTPSDLHQEEYYSIPLTFTQLTDVLDLLAENGETVILSDICTFLKEEYDINYVPFYEKD
jgi:hypothetical protein